MSNQETQSVQPNDALVWYRLGCWVLAVDPATAQPMDDADKDDKRPGIRRLRNLFGYGRGWLIGLRLGDASDGWVSFEFESVAAYRHWVEAVPGVKVVPAFRAGSRVRVLFRSRHRDTAPGGCGRLLGNGEWCVVPREGHDDWITGPPPVLPGRKKLPQLAKAVNQLDFGNL